MITFSSTINAKHALCRLQILVGLMKEAQLISMQDSLLFLQIQIKDNEKTSVTGKFIEVP